MGIIHDLNKIGISADRIADPVRIIERWQPTAGGTMTIENDGSGHMVASDHVGGWFVDDVRLGIIQNQPPPSGYLYNGLFSSDFTTAQYWVGGAAQSGGVGVGQFSPTADPRYSPLEDAWVPATNLSEWNFTDGGTHSLPKGTSVILFHLQDASGNDFYAFQASGPPGVIALVNDEPATADPAGEYLSAVLPTGTPSGMPPAGMTVPTTNNAVIDNLAEADFNNASGADYQKSHWAQPGTAMEGFVDGTGTTMVDGAPVTVPRVICTLPNPYALFDVKVAANPTPYPTALTTFTVKDLNGKILGTSMSPVWAYFLSPEAPENGQAYYDGSGDVQLATVDSIPFGVIFSVGLTQVGGSNGTGAPVANATYTYSAKDENGTVMYGASGTTTFTPVWARPVGLLTGPASNGAGFLNGSGLFVLLFTDEQAALAACS